MLDGGREIHTKWLFKMKCLGLERWLRVRVFITFAEDLGLSSSAHSDDSHQSATLAPGGLISLASVAPVPTSRQLDII